MLNPSFGGFGTAGNSIFRSGTGNTTDGGDSSGTAAEALNLAQANQSALLGKASSAPPGQSYVTDVTLTTQLSKKLDALPNGESYLTSADLAQGLGTKANNPPQGASYIALPTGTTLAAELDKKADRAQSGSSYVTLPSTTTLSTELSKKADLPQSGTEYVALPSDTTLATELDKKANTPPAGTAFVTLPSDTTLAAELDKKANVGLEGGFMDGAAMSVFTVTDQSSSLRPGAEWSVEHMFDGSLSTLTVFEAESAYVHLDYGSAITIDGWKTTDSAHGTRMPRLIRVLTGTSGTGPWLLAASHLTDPRPNGSTVEYAMPAPVTSRYFRLELSLIESTSIVMSLFAFRRYGFATTQMLSDGLALKADVTALEDLATTQALTNGLAGKVDQPEAPHFYVTDEYLATELQGLSSGGGGDDGSATYASDAKESADAAEESAAAALASELKAKEYRDGDGDLILGAKQYMMAASTSASNASTYRDTAQEHRDDAEGFRNTAEQHRDAAKEYRDGTDDGTVKGAADYMEDAKEYASTALTHKNTAKTKAEEAQKSATAAETAVNSLVNGTDGLSGLVSQLNANSINRSYWITSRDYDTSSWPDNNTMLRWIHGQATEPLAVLMFVRVLDPDFVLDSDPSTRDVVTQYILPLMTSRVQTRFLVGRSGIDARYVRISSDDIDFHIKQFNVTVQILNTNGYYSTSDRQGVVSFSRNVQNAGNVLKDDDSAATDNDTPFGLREIELDLGEMQSVTRVELTGRGPATGIPNTFFNGNMKVQFFNDSRTKTYDSAEGPNAVSNLMQGNGGTTYGLYGQVQFATGNGIEVTFDNSSEIDILDTNRSFSKPLLGSGAANRRFFMRALFDPAPRGDNGTTGFNETFFPPNEAGFVDFL